MSFAEKLVHMNIILVPPQDTFSLINSFQQIHCLFGSWCLQRDYLQRKRESESIP